MKYDIVLCGVGGQGIILLSSFLAACAHKAGLQVKQSEVHGMAQRGGSVVAHIRLSDQAIHSPLIPLHQADMIISMEPLEIYRYLDYAHAGTKIIATRKPVVNIRNYPEITSVLEPLEKAGAILADEGNNILLAGIASNFIPIDNGFFQGVLTEFFMPKGKQVWQKCQQNYEAGRYVR